LEAKKKPTAGEDQGLGQFSLLAGFEKKTYDLGKIKNPIFFAGGGPFLRGGKNYQEFEKTKKKKKKKNTGGGGLLF